jgi:shikimate dehydrogenase
MDRYAVIGNPVEHSLSPRIHAAFAAQTGQELEYGRLLAPLDGFIEVAGKFFAEGGRGLNVTVPFKAEAHAWMEEVDPLARMAGAVNTINWEAGRRVGYNTDGLGLLRDLTANQGETLRGARILLIGAGGAASGVVGPLLDAAPREIVVANRTPARARELVGRFPEATARGDLRAAAFGEVQGAFDVVINATSAGLAGSVAGVDPAVTAGAFCYDMFYGRSTAFCVWAGMSGARRVADGIGMLVEQAAEAFRIWRGIRPDTAPVLADLRAERGEPSGQP